MPFAFYDRLSPSRKRIYRKSDAILRIEVPDLAGLAPLAQAIAAPLEAGDRGNLERACQSLVEAFNARLSTPPVKVTVLERRPSNDYGELHGLYEPRELDEYARGERAVITVWMRTARKEQLVKYRTFLRTLVHEVVHHLDYEHLSSPRPSTPKVSTRGSRRC